MKKVGQPLCKTINVKLSIPYYSNSKLKLKKKNYNNSKSKIKHTSYNCNPKDITIKKIIKSNYITPIKGLNAYEKAEIESNITNQLLSKKYQTILQRDKEINYYLTSENNEIKKDIFQEKIKLKEDLSKIIKDTLLLSKNICKGNNLSIDNKIIKPDNPQVYLRQKNIEFLNALGINIESLNKNKKNYNINIDKAWNYINKIKKGKNNIDDILRYKIVNSILIIKGKNMYRTINKSSSNITLNNIYGKKIIKKKLIDKNKNTNNEINNKPNKSIIKNINNIPFDNNRIRMVEFINRSYNYTTAADDKNESQENNIKPFEIKISN